MLERDPSQLQSPDAAPGEADPAAPYGSRPAQNARQVDSAKDLPKEWRGADEAADFLGLEQELRGLTPEEDGASAAASGVDEGAPAESVQWLMHLDESGANTVQPVVPDALRPTLPTGDFSQEDELPPTEADGEAADPQADLDEIMPDEVLEARPRRTWLRAAMLLVLAGGGVAAYTYFTQTQPEPVDESIVARPPRPTGAKPAQPVEPPTPITASTPSQPDVDGDFDSLPTTSSTGAPVMPSLEFERWMQANLQPVWPGRDVMRDSSVRSYVFDPLHKSIDVPALRAALAAADAPADSFDVAPSDPLPGSTDPLSQSTSEPLATTEPIADETIDVRLEDSTTSTGSKSRMRRASKTDLAGIWEGQTIPMDRIGGPMRILTPQVGRVRTVLQGGEIFEGRLYAVGQQMVWLDTQLGRMALLFEQLERVEQISSPEGTPELGATGSQLLEGLPRVRVRVPGGLFYGKVTARDDRTVTLITDEGARVTLETQAVEPIPATTTVIVRPKKP